MSQEHPSKVSGGCLCGDVRYDISFEDKETWSPMVATCQCTMCRKWTGALFSTDLIVKKAQISPNLGELNTLGKYDSSAGCSRAFCKKCGSSVAWFKDELPEDVIIFVGSIDEEFLLGKVLEETIKETEYGTEFQRGPAYGKVLTDATTAGNIYWQNVIPNVTDGLHGPRFLQQWVGRTPLVE